MPAVLFGLVIMSAMALVAMNVSVEEHHTSRAVRTSLEAWLAAETGLNEIQAEWNDTTATLGGKLDTLPSGGRVSVTWTKLSGGASYDADIMRLDDGSSQPLFLVSTRGRDAGGVPSERALFAILTSGGSLLSLGACCESAATIFGSLDVNDRLLDGTDTDPPGWSANTCDPYEKNDKPALITNPEGIDSLDIGSDGMVRSGDEYTQDEDYLPPEVIVVDSTLSDDDFTQFGSKSWTDIEAQATHFIGTDPNESIKLHWGGSPVSESDYSKDDIFGPRVHSLGDPHGHVAGDPLLGTCDYDNNLNFGAPTGPCADHFPIISVLGEVEMWAGNGQDNKVVDADEDPYWIQGVVILAETNGAGSEFELEVGPGTLAGVILGRGCVEVQEGGEIYGSVFVNGSYENQALCYDGSSSGDSNLEISEEASVYYSDCAVQTVLRETGLGEFAAGEGDGLTRKLGSRALTEPIR